MVNSGKKWINQLQSINNEQNLSVTNIDLYEIFYWKFGPITRQFLNSTTLLLSLTNTFWLIFSTILLLKRFKENVLLLFSILLFSVQSFLRCSFLRSFFILKTFKLFIELDKQNAQLKPIMTFKTKNQHSFMIPNNWLLLISTTHKFGITSSPIFYTIVCSLILKCTANTWFTFEEKQKFKRTLLCVCVSVLQDHQLCSDLASDHCVRASGVSCTSGR